MGFQKATPDCGFGRENSGTLVSGSSLDYAPEGEKSLHRDSTSPACEASYFLFKYFFLAMLMADKFNTQHDANCVFSRCKDTTRRTGPNRVRTAFWPCRARKEKVSMLLIFPLLWDAETPNDGNQKPWHDVSEKFTWGCEGIVKSVI